MESVLLEMDRIVGLGLSFTRIPFVIHSSLLVPAAEAHGRSETSAFLPSSYMPHTQIHVLAQGH